MVDYKTGDVTSNYTKEKLNEPNDKDPNGGDYWRQAVFYKILVDNYDKKDWKVVAPNLILLNLIKRKNIKKIKVVIQPQDIETVTQQITTVWEKIQARDFYTGCGKEDCHWCNFVKENKLEVALHEMQERKKKFDAHCMQLK